MSISLEGADKVTTDLAKLGPAAQKAFADIQKAAEKAGVGLDKRLGIAIVAIRTKLAALQAAGARLAQSFNTFTTAVGTFGTAVANSAKKIGLITAAITGAIGAVVLFAKSTASNAERIDNQSKSLGISAQAYQKFETAAKNAGIEQAAFDKILQKFIVNAAEAGGASGEAAKETDKLAQSLRQVEVTAEDGSKKLITVRGTSEAFAKSLKTVGSAAGGGEEDLIAFAKRVTALGTAQERVNAVLAKGFDKRSVASAITFFRALAGESDAATQALKKIVPELTDLEIAVGVDLDNSFDRFNDNLLRTKDRLFLLVSPAIRIAFEKLADVIFENKAALEEWARFISEKAIATVKDLINALSGNDAAVQNKSILSFRDGVIAFGQTVKSIISDVVVPGFRKFIGILDSVAATINAVFGTEFTGKGILIALVVGQMVGAFTILATTLGVVAASFQLFTSFVVLAGTAFGPVILGVLGVITAIGLLSSLMADLTGTPFPIALWITAGLAGSSTVVFLYWEDFKKMATDALDFINQKFEERSFGERFAAAALTPFERLWVLIKSGATIAFNFLGSVAERVLNSIGSLISSLITKVRSLISALREAASSRQSAGESGGGGGFAAGGHVRGPGSGTSDSVPIWASNGEFVIAARMVRKYGPGLFAAFNRGLVPKGGFRFNMGGLVQAMAPRYASGGPVAAPAAQAGQGRAVVVNFGGESFEMSASESVVQKLMKAATGKQIRSNGRKPAWYGA